MPEAASHTFSRSPITDQNAGTPPATTAGPVGFPAAAAKPNEDVQIALTVLGRLPIRDEVSSRADLTGAQLAGAQLERANLSRAVLVETDLTGARLREANLTSVVLGRANLGVQ